MGYTTEFDGQIVISPPLNAVEVAYLRRFSGTRRMDRLLGPYYVDGGGYAGQAREPDIDDYNAPPPGQPGLWCHWVPTDDGTALEWDGSEKFYDGEEWMRYLIAHFLTGTDGTFKNHSDSEGFTFDHMANGTIIAQGEDPTDQWRLVVHENHVTREDIE